VSEEPERPGPDAEAVARLAEQLAEAGTADLTALLGRSAELKLAGVENIASEKVASDDSPIVHQLCRATGDFAADVHVLIPRPEAVRLAALQQGSDDDEISDAPLDAEMRAALQVVTKLLVGSLEAGLCEAEFQTSIELRDAREVPEPASDPTWLSGEQFQRLRFELALERMPGGRIDLLLACGADTAAASSPGSTILFLVNRESEQDSLEELAGSLGWPVSVACAEELGDAPLEDAGAIIVPWVVGGRSGLELVESFRRGPEPIGAPIVMVAEHPTRQMVLAALRAGAASFATLPYRGDELRRRILKARGEETAEADTTETETPGSNDVSA
jgi:CheY-like chemotaxis protein